MFTFPSRTTALTFTDWRHLEFKIIHAQRGKEIQRKTIIGILGKKKHMRRQHPVSLPSTINKYDSMLKSLGPSLDHLDHTFAKI